MRADEKRFLRLLIAAVLFGLLVRVMALIPAGNACIDGTPPQGRLFLTSDCKVE